MKLDYASIFEKKLYKQCSKLIPKELTNQLDSLKKVKRFGFKEYPSVLKDNTRDHTLRCVYMAINTEFKKKFNTKQLLRTLWIHDIPELITNDITVIEKYRSPEVEERFHIEELAAAKKLLNKKDIDLLKSFNDAHTFLKGKAGLHDCVSEEALLAKIIDNSEGNMAFHYLVSKWVNSKDYDPNSLPPKDSLQHTFLTNKNFTKRIKEDKQIVNKEELIGFIYAVLDNIRLMWGKVPNYKIPVDVKVHLKKLEKQARRQAR